MKFHFVRLVVLSAAFVAVGASALASDYAVLVGVTQYKDSDRLPSLRFCGRDAAELEGVLRRANFDITVLTNERGAADSDAMPNEENIRKALRRVRDAVRSPDSTLIIAFSGHGKTVAVDNIPQKWFLPADVSFDNALGHFVGGIDIEKDVLGLMKDVPATRKFLFVDACRDDEGAKGSVDPPIKMVRNSTVQAAGVNVIFSCRDGEFSREDEDLGHGVFFNFLIRGLKGEAAPDGDNAVAFEDLVHFVKTKVRKHVTKFANFRQEPEPAIWNERLPVIRIQQPGRLGTVCGDDPQLFGLPEPKKYINDLEGNGKLPMTFEDLTFTGVFRSSVFTGRTFKDCRFKNCTFRRSVTLSRAKMIDCSFENADFSENTSTRSLVITGRPPVSAKWNDENRPRLPE
jgi:hypothetical protein